MADNFNLKPLLMLVSVGPALREWLKGSVHFSLFPHDVTMGFDCMKVLFPYHWWVTLSSLANTEPRFCNVPSNGAMLRTEKKHVPHLSPQCSQQHYGLVRVPLNSA